MANKLIDVDGSEVRIGLRDLAEIPDDFNSRSMVTQLANFLAARMKSRTLQGLDTNLNTFIPYSPSYEKFKSKRGRGTNVNLTFSGQMMAGLLPTTVSDTESKVSMADAVQGKKAIIHQLGLGVPKREFFGIGKNDSTASSGVDKITQRELDLAIKRYTNKRG